MKFDNPIPESFWAELEELYETELEDLEEFFYQINKNAKEVVKENPESPLLYPFSLFQPMNRERDEVHYTKTLSWFMNYNKEILREILLSLGLNDNNLDKYHVEAEVPDNKQKNRLDIAIMEGNQIVVAIEAKIDSKEGKKDIKHGTATTSQLKEYDKWLNKYHSKCEQGKNRIFLVPDEETNKSSKNWTIFTWKKIAITLLKFLKKFDLKTQEHFYLSLFISSIIQDIYEINPKNNLAVANLINISKEK